ncbi:MAG: hypothetical protein LBC07_00255 [Elusimicrobiota bacterium]|jgi:spore photoproduct lyase|nr:hypothetical protein [Elusimicrobiota bacterium]
MQNFNNLINKFGINKKREIERLIFEIAKIENTNPQNIVSLLNGKNYQSIKKELLLKRYPNAFKEVPLSAFYLPKYEIDPNLKANISALNFYPKNIYYTQKSKDSKVFFNAKKLFANAKFTEISSLKDFAKNRPFTLKDFNLRLDNLILTEEKFDFFKKCPCTQNVVNCGYSIMNLGMGCPYECSYCFLQGYQNIAAIILSANIKDFLQKAKIDFLKDVPNGVFKYKRVGSGEFCDSLVFDNLTESSVDIIDFFSKIPDMFFEFKTKSVQISNLLAKGGRKNIVVSWSVNSLKMQTENEFLTPSILERLKAASLCAKAGFNIGFHFDPIIFYSGWRQGYKETVDMIFDMVENDAIKWISLGTLRMPSTLKPIIENRFPQTKILDGELILGEDFKLRYLPKLKIEMYQYISKLINSKKSKTQVYLCMENGNTWTKALS